MAEGPDPNVTGKEAEELEKEITCPVCQDHFTDPKILPCLHFYCKQCIADLAAVAARHRPNEPSFPCPECRADTVLPGNNVDRLPTAFFMNRMVAVVERMEKVDKEDFETPCEMCSERKVEAICQQCPGFICADCVKSHKKLKVFAGHSVVTFEEMKAGKGNKLPIQQAPPRICDVHGEQKKVYCYDCKVLICRDCTLVDHAGHKYDFVVKGAPQVKASIHDNLVPLRGCITGIMDAVKSIVDTKVQAVKQGATVDAEIKHYCKDLRELIEIQENKLLEKSAALVQKNMEALTAQEKSLASSAAAVQDLVESVDQTLENATDEELMEISDQILKRVDEETTKQATLDLKPLEMPNVAVYLEGKDQISEILQQSAAVYNPPLEISGPGLEEAIVKEPAYIHVQTADNNPAEVKASIKSLLNHSVIQFHAEQKEPGKYEIAYTPVIRGRHELKIIVNGVRVYSKPLLVRILPTQLSEPVRMISDLKDPMGVAFNSAGEVLVSECDGGVKIYDKYGHKLRKLKRSDFDFENLQGIAVDTADSIYVADFDNDCISKISKEGKLLKQVGEYGSGSGEFKGPKGLAIMNKEVYVCDTSNHRVQVFSTELEFLRMFGKEGEGEGEFQYPHTIDIDQDGLLYIGDFENHRVQVLTKQGVFVRSISGPMGPDHCLRYPSGVCIAGQYLYVLGYCHDDDDGSIVLEPHKDDDGDEYGSIVFEAEKDDDHSDDDDDSYLYEPHKDNDEDDDGSIVFVVDKDSREFVSMFGKRDRNITIDTGYIAVDRDDFVYVSDSNDCDKVLVF